MNKFKIAIMEMVAIQARKEADESHLVEKQVIKKMADISWLNPEADRPKPQDKIIFTDEIGLFLGYYESTGSGMVAVAGRKRDRINWEDIGEWIPYPKRFDE